MSIFSEILSFLLTIRSYRYLMDRIEWGKR
jgi:hypothetical protein